MNSSNSSENDFLTKLNEIVEANLTNPQFGVSMLARELDMSRSNLHRKVYSTTKLSVSQIINHVRLKNAMEMLRHTSYTVSDVAHQVGFSNTSYFIKCFHKYYGFTPGEVGNREEDESKVLQLQTNKKRLKIILYPIVSVVVLAIVFIVVFKPFIGLNKTIAILPARIEVSDTRDSTLIDGIIQNVIQNLLLVEDIQKVVPWHSVLQYKNSYKQASVIASEIKVNYIVKPTFRLIDRKTYLSFTLIEGLKDKLIHTYNCEIDLNDITSVDSKISKKIAEQINAQITPAEKIKIDKPITTNNKALKYYMEGIEQINLWREKNDTTYLEHAITQFEKTLENDNECASAYAQLARIYYNIDVEVDTRFSISGDEKTFSKQINKYADKALFYDNESDLSLLSKALYYRNEDEYEMAITYLEKALEYNSNSIAVIQLLYRIYYYDLHDLEKSLEFALLTMKFNVPLGNNFNIENLETNYLILGEVFRSLGFFEEALFYINKSLAINPNSVQAKIIKTEILVDMDSNYQRSKEIYLDLIQMGITSLEIKRLLAVSCYKLRDWESALKYYQELLKDIDNQNMDYNGYASGRLAVIFSKLGDEEKSVEHIEKYINFVKTFRTQKYGFREIIGAYSLNNETEKALEQLKKLFRLKTNYSAIRNFKDDPIFDNFREHPEFKKLVSEMEINFWANHERIRKSLEEKGLLNLNL